MKKSLTISVSLVFLAAYGLAFTGCIQQANQEAQKETTTQKPVDKQEEGDKNDEKENEQVVKEEAEEWDITGLANTSDWQSYSNSEHGFELKFPEQWEVTIEEDANERLDMTFYMLITPPLPSGKISDPNNPEDLLLIQLRPRFIISIYENVDGLTLEEVAKYDRPIPITLQKWIVVNGKKFAEGKVGGMVDSISYYIVTEARIYEINFHSYPPISSDQEYNRKIINEFKTVLGLFTIMP